MAFSNAKNGALLVIASISAAAAQNGFWSGPTSGFIFDAVSRSIRPIVGVPGSSYLGPAAAENVSFGAVSPDGRKVLATIDDRAYLIDLRDGQHVVREVPGVVNGIAKAAWAADSSCAAVYSSSERQWQRIRFGGLAEHAEPPATLGSHGGDIVSLAVSSACSHLAAVVDGPASGLYLLVASEEARLLASIDASRGAAVSSSGGAFYVLDRASQRLLEIQDPAGDTKISSVLEAPGCGFAVTAAPGRTRIYLLNDNPRTLETYEWDRVSRPQRIASVDLEFTPSGLDPLPDPGLYFLGGRSRVEEPVWVLDDRGAASMVYFVPAGGAIR